MPLQFHIRSMWSGKTTTMIIDYDCMKGICLVVHFITLKIFREAAIAIRLLITKIPTSSVLFALQTARWLITRKGEFSRFLFFWVSYAGKQHFLFSLLLSAAYEITYVIFVSISFWHMVCGLVFINWTGRHQLILELTSANKNRRKTESIKCVPHPFV